MSNEIKISATIITLNEEKKIEPCIKSLLPVADEIVVIDSCSTDRTKEICSKYTVRFISRPFEGYVAQKNFAVNQATHDYILSLAADERISEELQQSIRAVKKNWNNSDGYALNRLSNYCGKWMRFPGWYPERKIRLWDRRKAQWTATYPHDCVLPRRHIVKNLGFNLLHFPYLT